MLTAAVIAFSFCVLMMVAGIVCMGDDGIEYEHWEDVDFDE